MLLQMTFKSMKSSRKLQRMAEERLAEICSRYLKNNAQVAVHCELVSDRFYLSCRIHPGGGSQILASSRDHPSFEASLEQLCSRIRQQLAKRKWKRNDREQSKVPAKKRHLYDSQWHGASSGEADSIDAEAILQYEGLFGGLRKAG